MIPFPIIDKISLINIATITTIDSVLKAFRLIKICDLFLFALALLTSNTTIKRASRVAVTPVRFLFPHGIKFCGMKFSGMKYGRIFGGLFSITKPPCFVVSFFNLTK